MAVDFLARESHHAEHIYPTWHSLPKTLRGTFYVHPKMLGQAAAAGVQAVSVEDAESGPLTLVASYCDLKLARSLGRLVAYSEHGAGQSYAKPDGSPVGSGSYVGAHDRAGVVGVLVPGRLSAERHRASHPTIPAHEVGVPKLDALHSARPSGLEKPVVAVSFHWDCRVCAETRSAYRHYVAGLKSLAKRFEVIGHGHPRVLPHLKRHYERAGIEVVGDFEEVIERATVYAIDNSSTMYEWATLDRPVVVLNAPWYRRKVQHGLRFWSHADVGPHANTRGELPGAIEAAIEDPLGAAERRREIVRDVYVACDGRAAKRASDALRALAKEWG